MTRGMERPSAVAPTPVLSGMERPAVVTPAPAARRRDAHRPPPAAVTPAPAPPAASAIREERRD